MAEFRNPFPTLTKLPNRQRLHIYYHCNRYFYNNSYLSLLYVYINTQQKCNVKLCYFVAHLIFIYWSRPTSLHSLRPFRPIRHVNIENNRNNENSSWMSRLHKTTGLVFFKFTPYLDRPHISAGRNVSNTDCKELLQVSKDQFYTRLSQYETILSSYFTPL